MRRNRIMSVILMLTFVFSSIPLVGLADASVPSSSVQPRFEVIGSTIKNDDKFFELTMRVIPGSKGFFSAGMTLQYDKSVITPVAWDENGTVVPMSGCNDWQNVAVVPAICPTEISGKTAFVYEQPSATEEPTSAPTGEPTEAPTDAPTEAPTDAPTDAPTVAPGGLTRDGVDPTESTEPAESVEPTGSEPPAETNAPTGAPATGIPTDAPRGYLYISAEAPLPITAPLATDTPAPAQTSAPTGAPTPTTDPTAAPQTRDASAETPLPSGSPEPTQFPNKGRVVTIRFKYVGDNADAIKESKAKIENGFATKNGEQIVQLAPDDIAAASPAGQMVFYGAGDKDDTEYYYTTADTTDETKIIGVHHDELLKEAPEFILEKDVDSANQGGGSDPSKFAALVFFDWDKTTLLGSMVVNGASSSAEIVNTINEYAKGLMAPEADGNKPTMGADWASLKAKECTTYDTTPADDGNGYKYPLSSHDGYTFGKWIEFDSEDFTVYGEAVRLNNAAQMTNVNVPADPDFSKISGGLVLKAAYMANVKTDSTSVLTSPNSRNYTIVNKEDATKDYDPNDCYFTRFGSSNNYSVRAKVTRVNTNGQPVHRTRQTALKATFALPGGVSTVSLTKMEDIDEQIVEVAAPAAATSVTLAVIDIGGVSDWASGSAARSGNLSVTSDIYVYQGNIGYLNEYPETVDLNDTNFTAPGANAFSGAKLTTTVVAVPPGTSPVTGTAARRQAVRNIAEGQKQKLADNNGDVKKKYLTQSELQNAITYGHYLGAGH